MPYGYPDYRPAGGRIYSDAADGINNQQADCGNVIKIENLNINYGGNQVVRTQSSKVKEQGLGSGAARGGSRRESVRRFEYSESRKPERLAAGEYGGRARLAIADGLGGDGGRDYGRGAGHHGFDGPALGGRPGSRYGGDSHARGAGTSMYPNDAESRYMDSVLGGRRGLNRKDGYADLKAVKLDAYDSYRGGSEMGGGRPYARGDSRLLPRTMRGSEVVDRWGAGSRGRAPSLHPGPMAFESVDTRDFDRGRARSRSRAGSVFSKLGGRSRSRAGEALMIGYAGVSRAPPRARSEDGRGQTSSVRIASDWALSSADFASRATARRPASEAPSSAHRSQHGRHGARPEYSRHEHVSRHVRHYGPGEGRERADDYPTAHPKTAGPRVWEVEERRARERERERERLPPLNRAMLKALKGGGAEKERSRSRGKGEKEYQWVRRRG